MIGNNLLLGSGDEGYNLTRSLRFRASASASLSRTFGSPTNNKIWTISVWAKRGKIGSRNFIAGTNTTGGTNAFYFDWDSDALEFGEYTSSWQWRLVTSQVFRDPSAWYHIVVAVDTTQATSSNRVKMYVNGSQVTAFSTASYPTQNLNTYWNQSGQAARFGELNGASIYFDGYLTEVNFIDGQALTPSSFGETDTTTGVWKPKRYAGTYGTNGFYLPFTDNSGATATTIGKDFSGNGNNWTPNNISITSGITYDSMTDVPTLTSATAANYCVLNPLNAETGMGGTLGGGNLDLSGSGGKRSTIAARTGKWYWEFRVNSGAGANFPMSGLYVAGSGTYWPGYDGNSFGYFQGGAIYYNGSTSLTVSSYTDGDVLGFAWDADTGKVYVAKNGTWQNSGDPAAGTGQVATVSTGVDRVVGAYNSSGSCSINFGQRPFAYTPPTGFVALNTYNLPTSTIVKGNTVMDATLYTGNGSTQTITNAAGFRPDFVWLKSRNDTYWHFLLDSVRGATKTLLSQSTSAELTYANNLTSFNSNGFSLGNQNDININGGSFVGWQWQAGQGTTSSNTSGSITSTVSVNASAGFSVVTYTVPATNTFTVGHGLGVAPSLIFAKGRNQAYNWDVYHSSLGPTGRLVLNSTAAFATLSGPWANTAPTSTVFSSSGNGVYYNSGDTLVAYCWTPIAGYSAFGSYTGNGSTDGPFVYTGFRPRWIMTKQSSGSGQSWNIFDTARNTYNLANTTLYADQSSAEDSVSNAYDILSNGFKLRTSASQGNTNGATYVYMAFAENPFKNSLAR